MVFSNVNISQANFSFGPQAGFIYSFDHIADTLIVKTFPGGSLSQTLPLNFPLTNEVICSNFDGKYFYCLSKLGSGGSLGLQITKWLITGATVIKQLGVGNEINLINTDTNLYDSEALAVQRHEINLTTLTVSGTNILNTSNTTFLQIGDAVYVGSPSNVQERVVVSFTPTTITLNAPITQTYPLNTLVTYRKNIWLFNNKNNSTDDGSLLQISTYNGSILSTYSSTEWKHVTAADCRNGNILFVRNSQALEYRPSGSGTGYQTSFFLTNSVELDNTTPIKVHDIAIDSSNIYKLQNKRRIFNTTTSEYEIENSQFGNYEIDTEQFAARVTSVTVERTTDSVTIGNNKLLDFKVKCRSQYDVAVAGRNFTVSENDSSGFIPAGFNTFVTNSQGEGLTRYNSGANANFNNPIIRAVDVITSLRALVITEQLRSCEDTTSITQNGIVSNILPVTQYQALPNATQLIQAGNITNTAVIEQLNKVNTAQLEQKNTYGVIDLIQARDATNVVQLAQGTDITEVTEVTQYQFLLFAIPAPFSIKNPIDTNILVRIIGFGATPLNSATLIFKVNGIDVASDVVITPFAGGLQLDYNPPVNFNYSETVSIFISIEDTNNPIRIITAEYTFDTVADTKKPFASELFPPNRSVNNLENTEIYAIITDLETGIKLNSIKMYINGLEVTPTLEPIDSQNVKVSYNTQSSYKNLTNQYIAIYVKDNEDNIVVIDWMFTTEPSDGVLFINQEPQPCSELVPINTNICGEVYGLKDGINLKTLEFDVNGQKVIYLLKPKVYRKQ